MRCERSADQKVIAVTRRHSSDPILSRVSWRLAHRVTDLRRATLNRAARWWFRTPPLTPAQARMVAELRAQGYTTMPLQRLDGAGTWRGRLEAPVHAFAAEAHADSSWRTRRPCKLRAPAGRDAVLDFGQQSPMREVVDAFFGLRAKLLYAELWLIHPVGDASRRASQIWHRDPEDRPVLKAFLYCSEVTDAAGPFEYVPPSRPDLALADLPARVRGELPERARDSVVRVTCSAWTVMIADTSGLHRGGYASRRERLSATWAYVTPASMYRRRLGDA